MMRTNTKLGDVFELQSIDFGITRRSGSWGSCFNEGDLVVKGKSGEHVEINDTNPPRRALENLEWRIDDTATTLCAKTELHDKNSALYQVGHPVKIIVFGPRDKLNAIKARFLEKHHPGLVVAI